VNDSNTGFCVSVIFACEFRFDAATLRAANERSALVNPATRALAEAEEIIRDAGSRAQPRLRGFD
jgi:hypothetical protein